MFINVVDTLPLCCGLCGKKKKQSSLRTITKNILTKIRLIKGYEAYDLGMIDIQKRFVKFVIFQFMKGFANPFTTEFNYELPNISNLSDISLLYMATRASPIDYNEYHNCFLCEQNKSGKPQTKHQRVDITQICSKCFQKTGRGIRYPCLASVGKSAVSISNAVKELDPRAHDRIL